MRARHACTCPRLIQKHQLGRIQRQLIRAPLTPGLLHVGAFLLAGVQSFF